MTLSADTAFPSTVRPEEAAARKADYPMADVILNRWSPRAYSDRPVTDEELFTVLEAARWAPSSSNEQPWRFDRQKARETLRTPDGIELHAVIALGHPGTPDLLPEELREREKPNTRRPLQASLLPVPLG